MPVNGGGIAIDVQDPNGNDWGFNYDSNGNLILVADPLQHAWSFGYDSGAGAPDEHDLTQIGDADSNQTKIAYSPAGTNGGLVSSITDALGNETSYAYDGSISSTDSSYSVTATDQAEHRSVTDTYTEGMMVNETVESTLDSHYEAETTYAYNGTDTSPLEQITDPMGNVTTDTTDEVGNLITEQNNYGTTTSYYNSFDEPCWIAPPGVALPSSPSCYQYPNAGTGVTLYFYDAYGNLNREYDPVGNLTYFDSDGYGNPCWQTIPGTVVSGTPPPCNSPPAASTRYSYNAGDELLSESTPDGTGTNFTYDTTTYTYNPFGQVQTMVTPDGNVSGGNASGYTTTYYHDNAGRLYAVIGPMNRETQASLDPNGNVLAVTDPAGQVTSAEYDPLNRMCWQLQSSAPANAVCQTDPAGSTRYNDYADTTAPLTVEDPDNNVTTYAYANSVVPTSPTTVTDALGNITSNVYDADGNLCVTGAESSSLYSGSDPSCQWPSQKGYTYDTFDELGNVMSTEDPSGNSTTYTRGDDAYPEDVTASAPPSGGSQKATTYAYDLDGRQITEQEGNGDAVTTTYTATGQKCWEAPVYAPSDTCSTAAPATAGTTAWTYYNSQLPWLMYDDTSASAYNLTGWTYDAQGQETQEIDDSGSTLLGAVGYAYDAAGDNTCVAYPVIPNSSCANAASSTNSVVNYGYDADGRITSVSDWLGHTSKFAYDTKSNLTSIAYPTTAASWSEGFGPYDAANNLTELSSTSSVSGTTSIGYSHNADELYSQEAGASYAYNPKLQVTTGGSDTFGYNPNGEVSSDSPSSGSATDFNYSADGELTSKVTGLTTDSYAYDGNGNRCATVVSALAPSCTSPTSSTTAMGYNAYNELCYTDTGAAGSCTAPPSGATTYNYNGVGLRTGDTVGGVAQQFYYDTQTRPGQPLIIEDGSNAYIYGPANFGAGTAPIEQIAIPTIKLIGSNSAKDALGTSTSMAVTLPSGTVAGDEVVIGVIEGSSANASIANTTQLGGWSESSGKLVAYYGTVVSGETSVTASFSTSGTHSKEVLLAVYSGVNTANPIDTSNGTGASGAATSLTLPSLTTTRADDWLINLQGATGNTSGAVWGTGGMAEVIQASQTLSTAGIAQQALNTVGATGTRTESVTGSTTTPDPVGALIALEPAPPTSTSSTYLESSPTGVFAQLSNSGSGTPGGATYSTYGVRTLSGLSSPFGFQGAYTDPNGFLYLINRYYDPSTDQFISVDPDVAETGQPYAYDRDDPLNVTDPLGDMAPPKSDMTYKQETTAYAAYCARTHNRGRRADFNGSGSHCGQRWYQSKSLTATLDVGAGIVCGLAAVPSAGVSAGYCVAAATADTGSHVASDVENRCSAGKVIYDTATGVPGIVLPGLAGLAGKALSEAPVGGQVLTQGMANGPTAMAQIPIACH